MAFPKSFSRGIIGARIYDHAAVARCSLAAPGSLLYGTLGT